MKRALPWQDSSKSAVTDKTGLALAGQQQGDDCSNETARQQQGKGSSYELAGRHKWLALNQYCRRVAEGLQKGQGD
jgi:hypothetical protein